MCFVIIEYNRVYKKALHFVELNGSALDIANQKRSLNTFKTNYAGGYGNMDKWFTVKHYDDFFKEQEKKDLYLSKQLPLVAKNRLDFEHNNHQSYNVISYTTLWEFYTNIKYDYAKKKFLN